MIKIFIVDDHDIIREGLKRILNSEVDMQVVGEANNGNDVLAGISHTDCDVLILDLNLPGRDGFNLIQEIKLNNPTVKILVLSVYPEANFVVQLLRDGASGYLSKDYNVTELVLAVRQVHERSRYLSKKMADIIFDDVKEHIPMRKASKS